MTESTSGTWSLGKVVGGLVLAVASFFGGRATVTTPPTPTPQTEQPTLQFASDCSGAKRTWATAKQVYGLTHKRVPGDCRDVLSWYYARAKADSPFQYANLPPLSCYADILTSPECQRTPIPSPTTCTSTGSQGPAGPIYSGVCKVTLTCQNIGAGMYAGVGCKVP